MIHHLKTWFEIFSKLNNRTFYVISSKMVQARLAFLVLVCSLGCGFPVLSFAAHALSGMGEAEQSKDIESVIPSQLSRAQFVEVFGDVYEYSAWVAEHCYDTSSNGQLDNKDAVFKCMSMVVNNADAGAKLALIKSHPELGVAIPSVGQLTQASAKEQLSSGLSNLTPTALHELQRLNASYREKFGFPFVMAISGRRPDEIMAGLRSRLAHTRTQELEIAISEVNKIAFIRISKL